MNVLLINPPDINPLTGNHVYIESKKYRLPPLGLLYIAGYLSENSSHKVHVLDAQVEAIKTYKALEDKLTSLTFDVVGITTYTFAMVDVLKVARLVHRMNPKVKVVLGGYQATLFPEETINLEGVDYIVLGEGEIIFKELIDNINDENKLKNIKGLVFKDKNGQIVFTGDCEVVNDLDSLAFPARHLTPYKKYDSLIAAYPPATSSVTSRGCPYRCTFCVTPSFSKKFRAISAKRVVEEIETSLQLGIHEFIFFDSIFCMDKNREKDICRLIIEKKLPIRFFIQTRVDTLDEELLVLLKSAGCAGILYGVESGTDKNIDVLQKDFNIDEVKKTFQLTKKHGIKIIAQIMIGLPSETRQDIYETFRVVKELNPDYIRLGILLPMPGTRLYLDALSSGAIKNDHWREYAKNPVSDFYPPYWEADLSREELEKLRLEGLKSFYFRPSYILRQFFEIRSYGEFVRKITAGLNLFRNIIKKPYVNSTVADKNMPNKSTSCLSVF